MEGKMRVYRGEIKNMYIRKIDFAEGVAQAVTDTMVVRKDALFYTGITNRRISFEFNTYLATETEAKAYLEENVRANPNTYINSCLYVDYGTLTPEEMSRKDVKVLKKMYRQQRQEKETVIN